MSDENKKISHIDIHTVKKDLLEDLDDFLVDQGKTEEEINIQKKEALAKLDVLIKDDLSYDSLFQDIKEKASQKAKATEPSKTAIKIKAKKYSHVSKINESETLYSAHLVDLSKHKKGKQVDKKNVLVDIAKKEIPLFDSKNEKDEIAYRFPQKERKSLKQSYFDFFDFFDFKKPKVKLPQVRLKYAFTKISVFALILAVILLPIRGLMFFGQIQKDKDQIINFGKQGFMDLQTGVISASGNSYDLAQEDFDQALSNFHAAEDVLENYNKWLLEASSFVPVVGKPLSISRNMLTVASNISEAAAILNTQLQSGENPTEHLYLINNQITQTIPYLEKANRDLSGIDPSLLPENFRDYFASLKTYLPALVEDLDHLQEVFSLLLVYLGNDTEKRYLVLFQNNNELRPTGGFIGSFAIFDVYQGKVVNLEIPKGGMYDLEGSQKVQLKAPKALSLINPHFNIWDANWWPDFPTSAQKIVDLYMDNDGSSVDGVIAINAYVLRELLTVLGPIDMPEYDVVITAENIFDVLQEEVELNYDKELNEPKAIIADLVPQVLDRLLTVGDYQKDVVRVMADMLASKDIQLFSTDQATQSKLSEFAWAGEMQDNDKDFLFLVNTNIAGGKTDNDITQVIDHQSIVQKNGEIINNVRITRTNIGKENPFAGIEGGNVSYLRLYVPLGSEFIEGIGFDKLPETYFRTSAGDAQEDEDVQKEEVKLLDNVSGTEIFTSLDKTVFANWVALKPGETQTVYFKYKLPFKLDLSERLANNWWEHILDYDTRLDNYSLLVQPQSGNHNTIFNSSVLLPENVKVVWNNASDKTKMGVTNDLVSYTNDLVRDQYFGFIFSAE